MTYITLTILCSLVSSGYFQEANNADYNLIQPDVVKSQGNFYGQEERSIVPQPCSRHTTPESGPIKQHVVSPTYSSKIDTVVTHDNIATVKPHALRNVVYNLKTPKNQETPSYPQLNNDENNIYKTKIPLLVSNPIIDSFEEINHEVPTITNDVRDSIVKSTHQPHFPHSSYSPSLPRAVSEVHTATSKDFQSAPTSQFHYVPSNEYGIASDSQYLLPSHVIGPEHNAIRSTANTDIKSISNTKFVPQTAIDLNYESTHLLPIEPALELHSEPNKQELASKFNDAASTVPNEEHNKCTHEEPNNLVGHSRRSMSSYNDDDTLRDNLNSDNDVVHNNNDQYIESRIGNENAMASVLNVKPNTLKSSQGQNRNYAKSKLAPHEKTALRGRSQLNESRRDMLEPTRGNGVANMGQSSLMLMQTERICYACSTSNNPNCWSPDRRTTVKYCRKGNNACIIKTFGSGNTYTLIRDCGRSCDDSETGGLMPKYKSCSMCHSELCNGAYSIDGNSVVLALLLIPLIKYLN